MQKTPLSIRIIYILTSIIYYLTAFAVTVGILISISLLTGLLSEDLQLHVNMPVEVNFEEVGTVEFLGTEVEIEIVNAIGQIHFIDTPKFVARTFAVSMLIIFPFLFWLVYLFHRFIRNVNEGKIFTTRNFYILRNLSYNLVFVWLLMVVYMRVLQYFILSEFEFDKIHPTSDGNWYGWVLLSALFLWVLSHVFLKGLEINEENKLTI